MDVSSFLPLCEFQGLNSDYPALWQVPISEPSCQPISPFYYDQISDTSNLKKERCILAYAYGFMVLIQPIKAGIAWQGRAGHTTLLPGSRGGNRTQGQNETQTQMRPLQLSICSQMVPTKHSMWEPEGGVSHSSCKNPICTSYAQHYLNYILVPF